MAKLTPLQKRAVRKARHGTGLDMNLVSLIDVFTILIFFLLSNSSEVEILPSSKSVRLPESTAEQSPKDTLVVVVSAEDIVVDGRTVAKVADVMAARDDLIAPLKDMLTVQQQTRQVVRSQNAEEGQAITIMGDKDIPYQLLRKVMFSCARAGYADVRFAVRQKVST
ncbi:MAG: gliding motility protein [Burkholderiales bacterium PBB6]|jgi:biopolymer transport protein ExbD|uniref:Biopolymer transporter ExbD n=1 Tax=Ideonella margarita TaxID=2984191 RepID=A0ABU9C4T7_9BURK|nr:MAG: gliding motility protein [Burkholderiales bacterium PBB6]